MARAESLIARVAAGEAEFVDEEFHAGTLGPVADLTATQGLDFDGCRFVGLSLAGVCLRDWVLRDCTVEYSDLTGAELAAVELAGTRFVECKALGVDWSYVVASPLAPEPARFERCRLSSGTFRQFDLRRWVVEDCELLDAIFDEADLRDAHLHGCDLTGATFSACDLRGADLTGSHGFRFDVRANRVQGMVVTALEGAELLRPFGIELS